VTGGVAAGRPPFVGRERELSTLDAALQAAVAGTTSIVVVGGEAGSGKSRLLDEFSSLVRTHGVDVLSGRAWESGGSPAPRLVDQVSYRAFRGNADTLERWVEAAIEGCIHDARATRISQTADALDRQVSNSRQTCTEQTVGNDHD
jgi:predicted ATP-dependent serine protease